MCNVLHLQPVDDIGQWYYILPSAMASCLMQTQCPYNNTSIYEILLTTLMMQMVYDTSPEHATLSGSMCVCVCARVCVCV